MGTGRDCRGAVHRRSSFSSWPATQHQPRRAGARYDLRRNAAIRPPHNSDPARIVERKPRYRLCGPRISLLRVPSCGGNACWKAATANLAGRCKDDGRRERVWVKRTDLGLANVIDVTFQGRPSAVAGYTTGRDGPAGGGEMGYVDTPVPVRAGSPCCCHSRAWAPDMGWGDSDRQVVLYGSSSPAPRSRHGPNRCPLHQLAMAPWTYRGH